MCTLFVDILEITLPMTALILILQLSSPLIKKAFVAKWRYFMWLFAAVRLIIPMHIIPQKAPVTITVPHNLSGTLLTGNIAVQEHTGTLNVQEILFLIWIAGIALFALYQTISYLCFKRTVRRWAKPVKSQELKNAFVKTVLQLGLSRAPSFYICRAVSTPMVFGLFKPVLLLPKEDYTDEELSVILRHELIHYKRRDIFYKFVLMIANALHWFNPAVYWMVFSANKDIEIACDAEVVKGMDIDYRKTYCHAILNVVHHRKAKAAALSTCFIIRKEVIFERFRGILDLKNKRKGIALFIVLALSISVSGSLVSFAAEQIREEVEETRNILDRPTVKPKKEEKSTIPPTAAPTETVPPTLQPEVTAVLSTPEPEVFQEENSAPAEAEIPETPTTAPDMVYDFSDEPIPSAVPENTEAPPEARAFSEDILAEPMLVPTYSSSVNIQRSGAYYRTVQAERDVTLNVFHTAGTVRVFDAETGLEIPCTVSENNVSCILYEGQLAVIEITTVENEQPDIYIYGE